MRDLKKALYHTVVTFDTFDILFVLTLFSRQNGVRKRISGRRLYYVDWTFTSVSSSGRLSKASGPFPLSSIKSFHSFLKYAGDMKVYCLLSSIPSP